MGGIQMKYLVVTNEKGDIELKAEYTPELEQALQGYLDKKQREVQGE